MLSQLLEWDASRMHPLLGALAAVAVFAIYIAFVLVSHGWMREYVAAHDKFEDAEAGWMLYSLVVVVSVFPIMFLLYGILSLIR